jgi:hypothetical protein
MGTGNVADGAHIVHIIVGAGIAAEGAITLGIPLVAAVITAEITVAVLVVNVVTGFLCHYRQGSKGHDHGQTKQQAHKFTKHKLSSLFLDSSIIHNPCKKI